MNQYEYSINYDVEITKFDAGRRVCPFLPTLCYKCVIPKLSETQIKRRYFINSMLNKSHNDFLWYGIMILSSSRPLYDLLSFWRKSVYWTVIDHFMTCLCNEENLCIEKFKTIIWFALIMKEICVLSSSRPFYDLPSLWRKSVYWTVLDHYMICLLNEENLCIEQL